MSQKLKVELERRKQHEEQLRGHIEDAMSGIESICELKDMKNAEVGLYGISKRTEQEYIQSLNRARLTHAGAISWRITRSTSSRGMPPRTSAAPTRCITTKRTTPSSTFLSRVMASR